MGLSDIEVVIIGGGAAGIAAARRLHDASVPCLIVEARSRLGGRAFTVSDLSGFAIDLGCGWLHSADRNPWRKVAERQGRSIDKTPPPWTRPLATVGLPTPEQRDYLAALRAFYDRLEQGDEPVPDVASAAWLDPDCRWNPLINAASSYISGAELDRVSATDFKRYDDTGVNWRVVEGYGTTIAAHAADVPTALDCPVQRIDRSGRRLRIETAKGAIATDCAIVTLPSTVLAQEPELFSPALPEKTEAAAGLPLGLDDKLFIALDDAEAFAPDIRLFGHTDRTATAVYHIRPFGRPQIEAYFGGRCAAELETGGEAAFFEFARSELAERLGSDFVRRIKPIRMHCWGSDPFARGSYSYALPGMADGRSALAAPVEGRLFFAGEACSTYDFSTAHGGYKTGVAAAEHVIAARQRR